MAVFEERLLELLHGNSFQYSPNSLFTLASGRTSPYYIDAKKTLCIPEALHLVSRAIFERIACLEAERALRIDAIGGLTMGADPIAHGTSLYSHGQNHPIPWFSVRKEAKTHGLRKFVEGHDRSPSRVVIVDDVVTTGESTIKAMEGAKAAGFTIEQILVLVDRMEGGTETLKATGLPYQAIFTIDDLKRFRSNHSGSRGLVLQQAG